MSESMSYEQFDRARERILYETWLAQMAAGHLTEAGVAEIRSRVMFTNEFTKGPNRDQFLLEVNAAYAAMREVDSTDIPTEPGLTVPEDLAELDELTAPHDPSELDEPPEST
jgi:hypothetical protein